MLFFFPTTHMDIVYKGKSIIQTLNFENLVVVRWKALTPLVTPNGSVVNSHNFPSASNAVYLRSFSRMGIWWYADLRSNVEKYLY